MGEYLAAPMINVFRNGDGHDCEDLLFSQACFEMSSKIRGAGLGFSCHIEGKEEHESVYYTLTAMLSSQQV